MKRKILAVLIIAIAMIFSLSACGTNGEDNNQSDTKNEENVQIANPFTDCETMEDAKELTGFDMTYPESIDGYKVPIINAMTNGYKMVQVYYASTESDDSEVLIRKAKTTGDISGDYNSYSEEQTVDVDGRSVTMKGNSGQVMVAIWEDGAYTYAVDTNGLNLEEVTAVVSQVQ